MIGDRLEVYTFDHLMREALTHVPDTVDKRQGSIIFDALAPACYELAGFYLELRNVYKDTFASSAQGEALDLRVSEQGVTRYLATFAIKKAEFTDNQGNPMTISLGSRFSTVSDILPVSYRVTEPYTLNGVPVAGAYKLKCEISGTAGNEYSGNLINITHIPGLASATMSDLIQPARDVETDDELRERYFLTINQKSFGGNIAQYDEEIKSIQGVGELQIYPVWKGGGTVKCSIIDSEYNAASQDFITLVQNMVDPENSTGQKGTGLGMAPIGHQVTISTPNIVEVNIQADIVLVSGYTKPQVVDAVKKAINSYLLKLRKGWGVSNEFNEYSLAVYLSQIISAILTVTGIANVTNVKVNNSTSDLILPQTGELQQIPMLGEVILND